MLRFTSAIVIATGFALFAGSADAGCYPPSPAQNFSAYYYQSPGGLSGRRPHSVSYRHGCANHRYWNCDRRVNTPRG